MSKVSGALTPVLTPVLSPILSPVLGGKTGRPSWLPAGAEWGFTASPTPQFAHFGRSTNKAGALTSARNSEAYNLAGTQLFPANDPVVSAVTGLEGWGAVTNQIRNPRFEGATLGVVGSGGVLPTNMGVVGRGATVEILSIQDVSGLPRIRLKISGTIDAVGAILIDFEPTASPIVASSGQSWISSIWGNFVGTPSGVSEFVVFAVFRDASNAALVSPSTTSSTTSVLRVDAAGVAQATTVKVQPRVSITTPGVGNSVDFTIDIYSPQCVQSAFIQPPVLPPVGSPSAATRLADNTTIPQWQSFVERYSLLDGLTVSGTLSIDRLSAANNRTIFQAGSANEFARLDFTTANKFRLVLSKAGADELPNNFASGTWNTNAAGSSIVGGKLNLISTSITQGATLTEVNGSPYRTTKTHLMTITVENYVKGGVRVWTGAGYTSGFVGNGTFSFVVTNPADTTLRVYASTTDTELVVASIDAQEVTDAVTLESGVIGSTGLYDISARFKPGDYALTVSGGIAGDTDASAETLPDAIRTELAYVGRDIGGSLHWNGNIPKLSIGRPV